MGESRAEFSGVTRLRHHTTTTPPGGRRWLSWLARTRTHQLPEPIMQTLSRVILVEMCRERVAILGAAARDM